MQVLGEISRGCGQVGVVDHPCRQPDAHRPLRIDALSQEQQLGGAAQPDHARKQIGRAHVRPGQADPGEES